MDINFKSIDQISFDNATIGSSINDRFASINDNFQLLKTSQYLKGAQGDSIYIVNFKFPTVQDNPTAQAESNESVYRNESDTEVLTPKKLQEEIVNCIIEGPIENFDVKRVPITGSISLICKNVNGKNIMISTLPYVFIDATYLKSVANNNSNPSDSGTQTLLEPDKDLSCIIYFQDNKFTKSLSFPQIYFDTTLGQYCWYLNGEETKLISQGPKGENGAKGTDGKNAYFSKYNESGYITGIYDGGWKDESVYKKEMSKYTNNLTLSVKDVDDQTDNSVKAADDQTDNFVRECKPFRIGMMVTREENGVTRLKLVESSEISITLHDFLRTNPYNQLIIPTGHNNDDEHYHVIADRVTDDTNNPKYYLEMGVGKIDNNNVIIDKEVPPEVNLYNHYAVNYYTGQVSLGSDTTITNGTMRSDDKGVIIADKMSKEPEFKDGTKNIKNITVTVGAQTSTEYTVPYAKEATKLTDQPTIQNADKAVTIIAGTLTSNPCVINYAKEATYLTDKPIISNTTTKDGDSAITITAGGQLSEPLAVHADNSDKLGGILHNYYTALKPRAIPAVLGNEKIILQNGDMVYVKQKYLNFEDEDKLFIHFDISNHTGSPTEPPLIEGPDGAGIVNQTYMTILQCSINIPAEIKISQIECYNMINGIPVRAQVYTPAIDSSDWEDEVWVKNGRREIIWTGYKYKESSKYVVDWYQSHILYKRDSQAEEIGSE